MADEISIVVKAEDQFSGVLGNFGSILTGIESAINLIGEAWDFAVSAITPFIDAASESEQAIARLEGVLTATHGAAGVTSEELQNLANQLQSVTRFSDETILSGASVLLTFRNISGETLERTIPAMLDMAEIFGSVDSAAMQLGKALNDPENMMGALSRAGVTFSEAQQEMIKNFVEMGDIASAQNIILTEVENQVGGLAETMGNTFAGKVEIVNNKLDTLKELLGGPIITLFGQFLDQVIDFGDADFGDEDNWPIRALEELNRLLDAGLPLWYSIGATMVQIDNVAPGLEEFFDGLGRAFIGLQQNLDAGMPAWTAFREFLADILANTGVDFSFVGLTQMFQDWAESVDWAELSQRLIDGINSIDWAQVGDVIGDGLQNIVEGLAVIISEIDWIGVLNALNDALSDLFAGLAGYSSWEEMTDILSAVIAEKFRQLGVSIVDGIVAGIEWAWGNLISILSFGFDDIFRFVMDKLGISSPSTVFYEYGVALVEGLMGGWLAMFDTFLNIIDIGIGNILDIFEPILSLFGIEIPGGGASTGARGGTRSLPGEGDLSAQTVNNYYYGPVYFQGAGEPGSYYDCPSPNPFMEAGTGLAGGGRNTLR